MIKDINLDVSYIISFVDINSIAYNSSLLKVDVRLS